MDLEKISLRFPSEINALILSYEFDERIARIVPTEDLVLACRMKTGRTFSREECIYLLEEHVGVYWACVKGYVEVVKYLLDETPRYCSHFLSDLCTYDKTGEMVSYAIGRASQESIDEALQRRRSPVISKILMSK